LLARKLLVQISAPQRRSDALLSQFQPPMGKFNPSS
jgi:hypothetical protein